MLDAIGVEKSREKADFWLDKAAEGSGGAELFALSRVYLTGTGVLPRDEEKGAKLLLNAAQLGDAQAQYWLGLAYAVGEGVPQDGGQALLWLKKASQQNITPADDRIGWLYESGETGRRDFDAAAIWYRRANEKGNVAGSIHLAWLLQNGLGVPKDTALAEVLYRQVIGRDTTGIAGNNLVVLTGPPRKDTAEESVRTLQAAGAKGNAWAHYNLAVIYQQGYGVPVDKARADAELSSAAATGFFTVMGRPTEIGRSLVGESNENEFLINIQRDVRLGRPWALAIVAAHAPRLIDGGRPKTTER